MAYNRGSCDACRDAVLELGPTDQMSGATYTQHDAGVGGMDGGLLFCMLFNLGA